VVQYQAQRYLPAIRYWEGWLVGLGEVLGRRCPWYAVLGDTARNPMFVRGGEEGAAVTHCNVCGQEDRRPQGLRRGTQRGRVRVRSFTDVFSGTNSTVR